MSTSDEITKEKQRVGDALARVDAQREHTLGRLQFVELADKLLALSIDACERIADPLLLLGDLIQCRHSVPSRMSRG